MKSKILILPFLLLLFLSNTVFAASFSKDFLWGAATSAHQIEGGDIDTDWMRAEKAGKIKNGDTTLKAIDGYNLAFSDIKLLKDLGLNSYRFSIEWVRVEPKEGEFDQDALDHYRKLILDLKSNGIEPIVTLHHFTNPGWIVDQGGWLNKETTVNYLNYVEKVVKANPEVIYWLTINEPSKFLSDEYLEGIVPPYRHNPYLFINAFNNVMEAHNKAYELIHRMNNNTKVSLAYYYSDIVPKRNNFIDKKMADFGNWIMNWFWTDKAKDAMDFIGVNYYKRHYIGLGWPIGNQYFKFKNESDYPGFNLQPEGLKDIVLKVSKRYKKPVLITEDGLADEKDTKRTEFIKNSIERIKSAKDKGADVIGYLHWSLMDNFEWMQGYSMKFGLYEVDMKTFERRPRESALFYRGQIKETPR